MRERKRHPLRWHCLATALVLVLGLAGPGVADEGGDLLAAPLLPLLGVPRPRPVVVDVDPPPPACAPLPMVGERLPYGPGELLGWDLTVLGLRTGRVLAGVGERTTMDGADVYPVQARARTDGFLAVFGEVDARMVTYLEPATSEPVRMANKTTLAQPFGRAPSITREDAAIAPARVGPSAAHGARVRARLVVTTADTQRLREARLSSGADVLDVLSAFYWLRARQLAVGQRFCFDVYHRKRLFRVEGRVAEIEMKTVPLGARRALRLEAFVRGRGTTRPVRLWISDDQDRLPLLLSTPDPVGDIELRLGSFARGRPVVRRVLAGPHDG